MDASALMALHWTLMDGSLVNVLRTGMTWVSPFSPMILASQYFSAVVIFI